MQTQITESILAEMSLNFFPPSHNLSHCHVKMNQSQNSKFFSIEFPRNFEIYWKLDIKLKKSSKALKSFILCSFWAFEVKNVKKNFYLWMVKKRKMSKMFAHEKKSFFGLFFHHQNFIQHRFKHFSINRQVEIIESIVKLSLVVSLISGSIFRCFSII